MSARDYLCGQVVREARTRFGIRDRSYLEEVVDTWMDDSRDPHRRLDVISSFLPSARKILDMASGCGTCVFYGLKNGYDMYGVDPEEWKTTFVALKVSELGYPNEWVSRFSRAVGENLPFPDSAFDCVTTHQTLEHVQDVPEAIGEMIRVTKPGGGMHIHCPDYRSTFEGHYRLPWLPLLPKPLARIYLRALGRPTAGLLGIQ
jgi:ubiquinone/menaquinone biosynthesis C-methylase UbiE